MKILDPVSNVYGQRRSDKYDELIKAMESLPDNMSLPVECEDRKQCANIQYQVFRVNQKSTGFKYTATRRNNTIYITRSPESK